MEVSGKRADNLKDLCEICQTDNANGFCNDCKEYMCQKCFQQHTIAKPCRNHILTALDQSVGSMLQIPTEEKCTIHATENVRYYCRKHDVVGCGDCMISNHGVCKPEFIKDLGKNFEETTEFNDILMKIKTLDKENTETKTRLERNVKENTAFLEKALNEIRKFRKDINDYIDQAEKMVIAEANRIFKDNEILLSQLQQKITLVSKDIGKISKKLDTNLHKGSDLFIRMTECKPRVSQVNIAVAEIKSRNVLKVYYFKPEQKLRDLISSSVILGNIQLSDGKESQTTRNETGDENNTDYRSTAHQTLPEAQQYFSSSMSIREKRKMEERTLKKTADVNYPDSRSSAHQNLPEYFPPDPRSAGFDVDKRVEPTNFIRQYLIGSRKGTIVAVDAAGYVDVKWDNGRTTRETSGADGRYDVILV